MGASQSKTSVDIVNTSIIDCITNNINSCSSQLTQNQQVSFSGFGLFNSVFQSASLNVQCLQNITMTTDLSTKIAQQIQQDAEASAVALLPSYSGSSNTTNISNYIQTKLTTNIIQTCAASALQNQQVSFSGVQIGSAATQTLDLFSKCMQTALNNSNISQGLVQDVTQKTTATTTNPLDFLSSMFGYIVIGFILFIMLIIVIVFLNKRGSPPINLPINQPVK